VNSEKATQSARKVTVVAVFKKVARLQESAAKRKHNRVNIVRKEDTELGCPRIADREV
jgi:hypothetical protein